MIYQKKAGVPQFECTEYAEKTKDYVVLIPIINEGDRIIKELKRAYDADIADHADIVICDGGSTDGCTDEKMLKWVSGAHWNAFIRELSQLMEITKTASRMCLILSEN